MPRFKTFHSLLMVTLVGAGIVFSLLSPGAVHGQIDPTMQYRKLPMGAWVNGTQANYLRRDVENILSGRDDFGSNQNKLDQFFKEFIFPQMTQFDDASLVQLPEWRKDFLKLIQQRATSQVAHDHLVGLTMDWMGKIATMDFHPAVRYNAMLIIGEMNAQEAQLRSLPYAPPQPLTEALPILLRELDNPDQLDAVRVAALIGVYRHARMENENSKLNRSRFTDAEIRPLIDRMLEIIKAETPPAGRSEEGHVWMQRRAIEVLAEIGKVDAGGSVATELERIVKDGEAPISLRCSAARAIGKLSFTTVQSFDAVSIAMELGELAAYSCQQELQRVAQIKKEKEERELREQLAAAGPRGRGPVGGEVRPRPNNFGERERMQRNPLFPGLGGELGEEEVEAEWQMLVSKRRLKYQLGSVLMALTGTPLPGATAQTGLLQRAAANQKESVEDLAKAVTDLLVVLEAEVTTQEDLLKGVATKLPPLETMVGVDSSSGTDEALGPGAPDAPGPALGPGTSSGPGAPGPSAPGPDVPGPGAPAGDFPGAPTAPGAGPDAPAPAPGPEGPGPSAPAAPAPGVNN